MNRFFAHFLFILAAWTIVIKYLFPVAWALHEGVAPGTHVTPDLWPVVHAWLGWSLLHWRPHTFWLALGISIAEIAIVTIKFAMFLSDPQWTIWRTNWFINKIFVLACFIVLLGWLAARAKNSGFRRAGAAD